MTKKTALILTAVTVGSITFFSLRGKVGAYGEALRWKWIIQKVAPQGISPALISAIIWTESRGNPSVVGNSGEIGLMQIMPTTAQMFGVYDKNALFNPEINIKVGSNYLRYQLNRYNGNIQDAVAAYNAGTARKVGNRYINQKYVDKVISTYNNLKWV